MFVMMIMMIVVRSYLYYMIGQGSQGVSSFVYDNLQYWIYNRHCFMAKGFHCLDRFATINERNFIAYINIFTKYTKFTVKAVHYRYNDQVC
jgi:hypothetical protein